MVARRTFVRSALTATLGSDPGVDSNTHPTTIPQTNRRWPTMCANFRIADDTDGRMQTVAPPPSSVLHAAIAKAPATAMESVGPGIGE